MHGIARVASAAVLFASALAFTFVPLAATSQPPQEANPEPSEAIPAYHAQAPQGELPETVNPERFSNLVVQNAYAVAAKIKKTLYQEPCYCHCDRSKEIGRAHV